MNEFTTTLALLLHSQIPLDDAEWRQAKARGAWVRRVAADWRKAQRAMDAICTEMVAELDEAEFHALFEAEQAKVDAISAPLIAVIENDEWPEDL